MLRCWLLLLLPACSFDVQKVDVTSSTPDLAVGIDLGSEDLTGAPDLGEAVDLTTPDLAQPAGDLAVTPELMVTRIDAPANIDLTAEGTRDWMHFGLTGTQVDRKNVVTQVLAESNTGSPAQYIFFNPNISWSDGTPTKSATNSNTGVYIQGLTNGFTFTAPADTSKRTLALYIGEYRGTGTLVAHLSDGSLADVSTTDTNNSGLHMSKFTVEYRATQTGTLSVTWKLTNDNNFGAVDLMAITLF